MSPNPALHKAYEYGVFVIVVLVSIGCRYNGIACKQPCILVSNTTNILSINPNDGVVSSVVSGLTRAVAIDIDLQMGHVFWSDIVEKKIKRIDIDGRNTVTIIQNIGVCDGLAVEWRSRLIYWSDVTLDRIEVARLNGSDRSILISTGLSQPRAVAVEPEAGFLFWTDWGSWPKVERSTLSGENRMAIITSKLRWPNGLTVDFGSRVIYWIDSWLDKIESSDYQGYGRRLVSRIPGTRAFGLVLFGSDLLWSNWAATDSACRVNKMNGHAIQSYSVEGKQTMGITVFEQARQPQGARTCGTKRGSCSHLCLLKPGGYMCACPTGSKLNNDSRTCTKVEQRSFFLVATQTKIFRVDYATGSSQTLLSGFKGNLAIDVDVRKKRIYWSNRDHRAIFRANIDGKNVMKIMEENIGVCGGLAVEWRSRLLYWTDSTFDKIEVASLNGQNRRVLFRDDLNDPWGIAVEPEAGYLFWTTVSGKPKIERSSLSGKNRTKIATAGIEYPTGITIDYANRRIYWVDGFFGKIEFADYDGNNRKRLQENPSNTPTYLTVSGAFVYWTDRGQVNSVSKTPKELNDPDTQSVFLLSETPFGIAYFDQSRQPKRKSECTASKSCTHLCLLESDGHTCACPDGLLMSIDQNTCQHASEIPEFLMVVQKHSKILTLLTPDGRSSTLQLASRGETITAVDYDPTGGSFVFARTRLKSSRIEIFSTMKFRTVLEKLTSCNVLSPESLAVDWRGENVYWTDSQKGTIEVMRVKGKWRMVLHRGLDTPKAIALQQDFRLMAWSECGMFRKIMLSNMDGSEKAIVINSDLSCAHDLILDRILKKIYWRNAWINTIEMSNLDGSGRETVLRKGVSAFTMTNRFVYWSESRSGTLYRRSRRGDSSVQIVSTNLKYPFFVRAFTDEILSNGLFPRGSKSNVSLCSRRNGDCGHFCLSAPKGIKCACSSGYFFRKDNKSCEISRSEGSLLIADATGPLTRLPLIGDKFICSEKLLDNGGARAVTYDPRTEYIYWSNANFIHRAKKDNKTHQSFSPTERVATFPNSIPNWLAIDWISGNLFWTFLDRKNVIGVSRVDGTSKKTLITDAANIGHIAINPIKGRLYWIEDGSIPKIVMSNMDGDSRRAIVELGLKAPMAVAVDPFSDRIFWIDSGTQIIEQSDFEGKSRIVIFRLRDKNPRRGLVYFKNTLYWTNPHNERLESVNIISRLSRTLIIGLSRTSFGLAVQSKSLMQGTNQCERLNGGCSNLCFPTVYGRECSCPDGVELRSDDLTTCEGVNRCPVLQSPQHGTKEECRNVQGIKCRFSCDFSHRLVGSEVRTCLQNGSWSGMQPRCESFMCPAIFPPKYGSMDGASGCNDGRELPYNSYCVFRCSRPGFVRQGPAFTRCLLNGTWSVNSSSVICKDTQSPKITCPKGVKLLTNDGKSTALYNWTAPIGEDNSGDPVKVQVKNPGVVPPYRFPYGVTVVKYIAEDASQLQSGCSFTVEVADAEPPKIVYCPKTYKIISTKRSTNVTLPYVKFADNVEVNRIVYDGPVNGSGMHWGKHRLHFTAYDKDQNLAKCIFTIEIVSKTCHLDPPIHGTMSCETWLEGGRYCSIHCNKGYEFAVNVQDIYVCDGKGLWRNVPKEKGQPKLPDCSPLQVGKENFIQAAVRYKADSCYDPATIQRMKTDFINKFKRNIFGLFGGCIGHADCRVENVEVVCHRDTIPKRLKKRSTNEYVITIQFEINLPVGNESFVKGKELNSTSEMLNATASKFVNIVETIINSSSLDINIGNKTLQPSRKDAVLVSDVGVRCLPGQKTVDNKCVSCPLGTYHNATKDQCVPCPVDSYQDQEGQLSCKTCPAGSSTWGVKGARWIDYCAICKNRFLESKTGHCNYWKKKRYCKTDHFVMARYCPLACGFCGTCPALDRPEGMIILPPTCAKKRVPIGTTCTILCEDGYKLAVKAKLLGCRWDGTWSGSVWDYKCLRIIK